MRMASLDRKSVIDEDCVPFASWESVLRRIIVLWLIEQKIRGQFLVLVASEVSLDGRISVEAQSAQLDTS